jgi:DNA-binding MarR family transcriptional regulator
VREAEQVRYLILAAQREGNRRLTAELKPLSLTPAQAEVLRILGENPALALTGVGQMLVCDSGTNPSRIVDRLVDAGLVDRSTAVEDRRQIRLTLTAAGEDRERAVRKIEDSLYADIDRLGDVSGLIAQLRAIIEEQPCGQALKNRISGAHH